MFKAMGVHCARCGAEVSDEARFCASCGAAVDAGGGRERKLATIVFADIVGSTELVDGRDPEDVRRALEPFFDLARAAFEEHGGRVEKFIGDAAMAVFGVPQVHGDDPDRAVAAALALIERVGERGDGLELRIGIETGEVLAESGGADLAVTGEATSAAARLQQAAAPDEILVGERAAAGCRRAVLSRPREIRVKGFAAPLVAHAATGVESALPVTHTPFLGRGEELESLRLGYLRTQRERRPTLALVVGEAGLGKTRLARELLDALAALSPVPEVLVGRNPPYGDGIAFWAFGEILRAAGRVGSDASSAEIHDALEIRLTAVEPERRGEVAATLVAVATGEGERRHTTPGALRLAWRRLLTSLASERPLVIAVDDAHWADDEFLELLEDSAATLNGYPILFLCTARPSLLAGRPAFAEDGVRVELEPLRSDASVELAAALLDGADTEMTQQVADTSGGNPFFAEEIAHSIAAGNGDTTRLPDTVQTAIASRLDSLPGDEKLVLQHAAVLGDRFRAPTLAALLDAEPDAALAGLASRSLLHDRSAHDPGLFTFHHQLIRDVAYDSLPRADRTRLHERAAAGIGPSAVEHHPELAEVIAFHLMQAAELEPSEQRQTAAFDAACKASSLALRRGAAPRAQELLEQVAQLAPLVEDRIDAMSDAADIAMSRARGDEAYRLLRTAGELAESRGLNELAAMKYALAVEVPTRSGGISAYAGETELPDLLEHARALAPDPATELRAQLLLDDAWIKWRFGPELEMGPPAREALDLARASGDVRLLSSALDAVGAIRKFEGNYREAVASSRERLEALAGVEEEGILVYERHDAVLMLGEDLTHVGDLRGAIAEEVAIAPELLRMVPHRAYAKTLHPLLHLGEWDRAIEYGMSIRTNWIDECRPPFAPLAGDVAVIGFIHGVRDDDAGARDWFAFATEMALDGKPLAGVNMFKADLELYRGDPARALEILDSREREFWWGDAILVKRAEILAAGRLPGAAAGIAAAEERATDDPLHSGLLKRAHGFLEGEPAQLAEAAELFDGFEYAFEAARTRWHLGGEERERALAALGPMGAVPPNAAYI